MIRLRLPAFASLTVAVALAASVPLESLATQQTGPSPGLDAAGMDPSVKPGDNFFSYANGTWLKQTEIPADRSSYGTGVMLVELTDRRVADLIQESAKANAPAGSDLRKIGDYYASFMDTTAIAAAGLKPLQPTLDSIAAIRDRKDLARVLGSTLRADVDALNNTNFYTENLLGLWVAQDLDDPTRYSPFLLQGGLGMPDRSYYVDSSAGMAAIRGKYQEHVAAMLQLANIPGADAKAAAIVRLETGMAKGHASREESGDVSKGNNHWTRTDFGTKAPGLDWETYFAAAGLDKPARFVGHDAADRERGEPAGDERHELPRRNPAASLLRSEAAAGHGLRRHGGDHRPRGQSQLRQPGRALRRHRTAAQLVDARGLQALRGLIGAACPAVRRVPTVPAASPRRWHRAARATSSSSSALPRPGGESFGSPRFGTAFSRTDTHRTSTGHPPCETWMRGIGSSM